MQTKKITYGAVFLALAVLIPYFFHTTGINGKIFLPMHIPVLLAGFILGSRYGVFIGALAPVLNFLVSGMPPVPMVYVMPFELAAYGMLSGVLYRSLDQGLIVSLLVSMTGGRVILGLAGWAFIQSSPFMLIKGSVVTGLPGLIIQLILIPIIMKAVEKAVDSKGINLNIS